MKSTSQMSVNDLAVGLRGKDHDPEYELDPLGF